jgi:hypothetical protein
MIRSATLVVAGTLAALMCAGIGAGATAASRRSAPTSTGLAPVTGPCSANYVRGPRRAARTLRFGIDPELAGTAGASQESSRPLDRAKALDALRGLRPPGRELVLRINRLFEAAGEAGIRRIERTVGRYTRAGFETEIQVRYHPSARQQGKIDVWKRYVRRVVDTFGPNRHVIAMTITNEVNVAFSPNTSDGAYPGAEQALIQGIIAAHREAQRRGFTQLRFGFTFAYRFDPTTDAAMFTALRRGGAAFRNALGFVGVDYYPELYPGLSNVITLPETTVTMLATMRRCFMALGRLGASVPLWITESGYDTTPGPVSATQQRHALVQIVDAIRGAARTYGVTDYRWFNLRDSISTATGFAQSTGLLTDDYGRKPAFAAYRGLIARFGARAPGWPSPAGSRDILTARHP